MARLCHTRSVSAQDVVQSVVWRTGALGDFVLTLPVLWGLRERSEHLTAIAPARYQPLFDAADRWIDADGLEAMRLLAGGTLDADLAVAWSPIAAQAFRRMGVAHVAEGTPMPGPGTHQVDALWAPLVPVLGPRTIEPHIRPRIPLEGFEGCVVIAPGSGGVRKRWGLEAWHAVAEELPDVLWVGGPQEACETGWGDRARFDLDLEDLCRLAAACRCWLGPDAGPQHLAAACGARVGAVFVGATDPVNWAPRGARVFAADTAPPDVAAWARGQL